MKYRIYTCIFFLNTFICLFSQQKNNQTDTLTQYLPDVTVIGQNSKSDYQQMPEIVGTNIYAGKKNALIVLDNVQGNIVNNTMRQVLAKVAGIHIWESDPSGAQIGIAARGLSPNRSWEFNTRQNGYDISADPFGYPEAYYNPPLQAVQRIEIVRGQGSLQYGPQFGGLVNYIIKNGSEIKKPFQFETNNTIGSNGLFSTYNALGGTNKKTHYYTFFDHRSGNGYRQNSKFKTNSFFGTITHNFSKKISLIAEIMQYHLRSQQPGGLTDEQLNQNNQQSLRSRNWFDIKWTAPALILNYQISEHTKLNTKLFATLGDRNSVGFMQPVTVLDTINKTTNTHNNRILNEDKYRNYGFETRFITNYNLGKLKNTISTGVRLFTGTTTRLADGKGSTGTDYNMKVEGLYNRDIQFSSNNFAMFAENLIQLSNKFIIIPGIRYEWLQGKASGRNGFDNSGNEILLQNVSRSREFVLMGVGAEYHITKNTEVYGNYTQAYRPIQFANLQAPPTTDIIDPNLQDAKGFNFDLGYRGKVSNYLVFDISAFYLQYNNRIGTVTTSSNNRFTTNIGSSDSKGFETFIEFNVLKLMNRASKKDIIIFTTYAHTNAKYNSEHKDANVKGKQVENAPQHIFRGGITFASQKMSLTTQISSVSSTFSDANNTTMPTANGNNGLIPSYKIVDINFNYSFKENITFKAGLNNVFNENYFTRRAGGYPGPGALPADGRTFFISLGLKL